MVKRNTTIARRRVLNMRKRYYKARPVVDKVVSEITGITYDSKLELNLHEGVLEDFDHHPSKIGYIVEHTYQPDFCYQRDNGVLYIETKGFFQDSTEASKYKWIREHMDDSDELVFIFERPNSALPWSKKRKDGTRMTHEEWATRNNFRSYGPDVTLKEVLDEKS